MKPILFLDVEWLPAMCKPVGHTRKTHTESVREKVLRGLLKPTVRAALCAKPSELTVASSKPAVVQALAAFRVDYPYVCDIPVWPTVLHIAVIARNQYKWRASLVSDRSASRMRGRNMIRAFPAVYSRVLSYRFRQSSS